MSKDWTGNKTSTLSIIGARNYAFDERENNDYYATDPKAVERLLEVETFNNNIWENACGEGNISEVLKKHKYNVYSTDLIDRGYQDELVDFLCSEKKFNGDIITNPPYKYITEFVLKSLEAIPEDNKVAMLLKINTLEGINRYNKIYSKYPPKIVYVFSKRIKCAKNNDFSKSGTGAVCYAWYVWQKGFVGCTQLTWI